MRTNNIGRDGRKMKNWKQWDCGMDLIQNYENVKNRS